MALLIGDILSDAAAVRPRAVAATLGETSVTFREADRSAGRMANALAGLGVGPGDRVAWWTPSTLGSLAGFFGCARIGAPIAPVSPLLTGAEADAVLEYLAPRLLVADAARAEEAAAAAHRIDAPLALVGDGRAGQAPPGINLDDACAAASPSPPATALSDDQPHVIYLTSGTTGRPKGVVVSHRASWLRSFPGGGTFALGPDGDGGILTSFPLYHYGGWHYVLEAWHNRCAVHVVARANADHLLDAVDRWRPTGMYLIPAVWARVLEADRKVDMSSLRHADTGTSATPLELLLRIKELLPDTTTSVLYGSTEAGHHTTLPDRDLRRKPGSVGRPAPPTVLRLSDDGEVCIRGETVMSGYLGLPEATDEALRDGWYHTGDIGHLDEEGYLFIVGRRRELIRSGGEGVPAAEVEAALAGLRGVRDAAVVGVPDPTWGEIVCAVLVMEEGHAAPGVEDVRAHVAGRLAPFKQPRRVVTAASIPRTGATGQVQRALLRGMLDVDMAAGGGTLGSEAAGDGGT